MAEKTLVFDPLDNKRLAALCGYTDSNIHQIEQYFEITISNRANSFQLTGAATKLKLATQVLEALYEQTAKHEHLSANDVHLTLCETHHTGKFNKLSKDRKDALTIKTQRSLIAPRNKTQADYIEKIAEYDINFCIGPAGTGKTFLAVAAAVQALDAGQVHRILLVRPAVEAGESLGFLPGDFTQKVDPYLRPLYDALHEMVDHGQVERLIERNVIEVAPLAYMRGRTLNEAFVILDESQNSTREQMKMCLTRLGYGTKIVVTGDVTQIDLPRNRTSGLVHANAVLHGAPGIGFTEFSATDVVRHPLVQAIVEAYHRYEAAHDD